MVLRGLPADPAIGYGYGVGDRRGVCVTVLVFVTVEVKVVVGVVEGVTVHDDATLVWIK